MWRIPFNRARFSRAGQRLLDWILPTACPSCGVLVASDDGFCVNCWSRLNWIDRPYCARLGIPFAYDIGPDGLSAEAIANPPPYRRARAAVLYDDDVQKVIHRFKYLDQPELGKLIGGLMVRAARDCLDDVDVIIPVPLHRGRLWQRRYNQSAELARTLSERTGLPVDLVSLQRIRSTTRQVGLRADERKRNVQGAFRVSAVVGGALEGQAVLLVDDVLTTGATVEACARALTRGGARAVDVVTFARVAAPGTSPI